MKLLLWVVTLLILLLWTGTIWVFTGLADWLAAQVATGEAANLAAIIAQWPVPPELAPWIGEAFLLPLRDLFAWTVGVLESLLPFLPSLVGILSVLLWVLWFIVAAIIVVLALLGHWALSKAQGLKRSLRRPA
ncbi:hypothetical protein [Serpentinimonas barnesii]|uniref:hypothetical protein n=1 Tax=Serpentinimonas barnesii TaxID=1458427 RepID=UPI0004959A31|nr:hypothetical protein [Serpentinimonas barnesii]